MNNGLSNKIFLQEKKKGVRGRKEENTSLSLKQADTCQNYPWKSPIAVCIVFYAIIKNGLKRTRAPLIAVCLHTQEQESQRVKFSQWHSTKPKLTSVACGLRVL